MKLPRNVVPGKKTIWYSSSEAAASRLGRRALAGRGLPDGLALGDCGQFIFVRAGGAGMADTPGGRRRMSPQVVGRFWVWTSLLVDQYQLAACW